MIMIKVYLGIKELSLSRIPKHRNNQAWIIIQHSLLPSGQTLLTKYNTSNIHESGPKSEWSPSSSSSVNVCEPWRSPSRRDLVFSLSFFMKWNPIIYLYSPVPRHRSQYPSPLPPQFLHLPNLCSNKTVCNTYHGWIGLWYWSGFKDYHFGHSPLGSIPSSTWFVLPVHAKTNIMMTCLD